MDFQKLFDLSRWFAITITENPSPLYLVALAFFVVWTIASIYVYRFRRRVFVGNGARIGVVTRHGPWAIAIGIIGLIFVAARYTGFPILEMRFLLYLTVLAAVVFAGYIGYYLRRRYPFQVQAVRAEEVRRRYAPVNRRKKRRR